jgi:hypothetical protein
MESKYNMAIERSVLLEEEIKNGEQEREALRIENQRLRDELSDLKVEAEIRQDKLRHVEAAHERSRLRKPTPLAATIERPQSAASERSPATSASSPTFATPPTKSISSAASDTPTPPSPPESDRSAPALVATPAQAVPKSRLSVHNSVTPRQSHYSARPPRHSRGGSMAVSNGIATPSVSRRSTLNKPGQSAPPSSASLTHIRGLMSKMQKLEQRVQSARSKLPAPTSTPPTASPRPGSALSQSGLGQSFIPTTVTIRSSRKRAGGSIASAGTSSILPPTDGSDSPARPTSRSSRLSYGYAQSTPNHTIGGSSRPSSRASISSRQSITNLQAFQPPSSTPSANRPGSRASMTGSRTALGCYPNLSERPGESAGTRPRSSIGGSYAGTQSHGRSLSRQDEHPAFESPVSEDVSTPTPARRPTNVKEASGIPMPGSTTRRQSGVGPNSRRTSNGLGDMGPPLEKRIPSRKLSGVGEAY